MAPELLIGNPTEEMAGHQAHTKATDVWAFGMVVYVRLNFLRRTAVHKVSCIGSLVSETALLQCTKRRASITGRNAWRATS
jgi:serine/threonine protein kinase